MFTYTDVTWKLILGLVTIVLQINLSGKSNLAPISALDQVQNYVLGGLIGGMIYSANISALQFILVLLIWTILVAILRFITRHNQFFKKIIDGKPQLLIENGQLHIKTVMQTGLSANDLMFRLRSNGVSSVNQVKRAVLEQNGQLTVTQKTDDLIKYPIISDGQLDTEALQALNKDSEWVNHQLEANGRNIKDVYLATYEGNSLEFFFYPSQK